MASEEEQRAEKKKDIIMQLDILRIWQTEKLSKNMHKRHWKYRSPEYLLKRLDQEVEELRRGIVFKDSPDCIARECADIANFCMMIIDNYKKEYEDG